MSESGAAFTDAITRQKAGKSGRCARPRPANPAGGDRLALLITVSGSLRLRRSSQLAARHVDATARKSAVVARAFSVSFLIIIYPLKIHLQNPLRALVAPLAAGGLRISTLRGATVFAALSAGERWLRRCPVDSVGSVSVSNSCQRSLSKSEPGLCMLTARQRPDVIARFPHSSKNCTDRGLGACAAPIVDRNRSACNRNLKLTLHRLMKISPGSLQQRRRKIDHVDILGSDRTRIGTLPGQATIRGVLMPPR